MEVLTPVSAQRRLVLQSGQEVLVLIGVPRPTMLTSWECQFQIVGLGYDKIQRAMGEDSVQALLIAIQSVGARLYTSQEWKAGELSWELASVQGDLGIPVPSSIEGIPSVRNK